jgi:hypothetical protein
MMLFAAGLVAFFALNVADMILTQRVLDRGGKESNPALAKIMRWTGGRWRLIKMLIATGVVVALWMIGASMWAYIALMALNAAWVYVVWHNARVLSRMD